MTPKIFRSHRTTAITTTAFRIDLIEPAIGMKLFTNQSRTPTTIRTINTWSKGMIGLPPWSSRAETSLYLANRTHSMRDLGRLSVPLRTVIHFYCVHSRRQREAARRQRDGQGNDDGGCEACRLFRRGLLAAQLIRIRPASSLQLQGLRG